MFGTSRGDKHIRHANVEVGATIEIRWDGAQFSRIMDYLESRGGAGNSATQEAIDESAKQLDKATKDLAREIKGGQGQS